MNVNKKTLAYLSLILVVLIWGCAPYFLRIFFNYYSPTVNTAISALIACVSFALISGKNIKLLNKEYLKVALPIGFFYSTASVLQKVGLPYTTDTQYAFLENLSCVVVPVLVFIFVKKKPSFMTISASVLCLVSCFILSGINLSTGGITFGVGELLCALAGIFYGVNIAGTGVYAKKFNTTVYLTIIMFVEFIVSVITIIVLNFVQVGGKPVEAFAFKFDIGVIAFKLGFTLISTVFCWFIRVWAMKQVEATVVAVIMPMSALVTTIISVLRGAENITLSLVLGAFLGLVASVLSGIGDAYSEKKMRKALENSEKNIYSNNEQNS